MRLLLLMLTSCVAMIINASEAKLNLDPTEQTPVPSPRIDFKLRETEVSIKNNVNVSIPPRLFQVWKTLRETMQFEVGGGLDFNFYRELERVKLTYGQSKTVSYIPDFEVAWHTHPGVGKQGGLQFFSPPSPSDIKVAVQANYNHWLLVSNQLKADFSNVIIMTAYSTTASRPMAVEMSITMDAKGIYTYHAKVASWIPVWQQGPKHILKETGKMSKRLQQVVNDVYPKVERNEVSTTEARRLLLQAFSQIAQVNITFYPWQQVLQSGLQLNLEVVELLQSKRVH